MHGHCLLGVELILCGLIFWGLCSRRRRWKREPKAEPEEESVAKPEADPEVEPEEESEEESVAEPEEESVAEPEIEPEEESEEESVADPEEESVAEPEADPEVEPEEESEEESVAEPEIEPEEESEEESVAESEADPEVEPEEKSEEESVADPEEESVAEPEIEPEEESEEESVAEPEIEPEEEPEEESVAESEANPEVEPEEESEEVLVADPEVEAEEESVAESEADPEVEPEEESVAKSEADPEVRPEAGPEEESEADPQEESVPNPETWTKKQLIGKLKVISKGGVAGDRDGDICFVQEVVEHLLDVARASSQLCTDMLQEGCVGVGSQFEGGWSSGRQKDPDYDMLVVINPPRTLSFQVELGYNDASNPLAWEAPPDYRGQGRVRLISTSPPSQGVPPRPHELNSSLDWMGPGEHLEPALVLQWLGSALKKAWGQRTTMKVTFGGAECPCRLQLENPSGHRLYVNLVPAVRVEGTNAFLVTQGPVLRPPEHWVQWFSVDEGNFLRDVTQKMPSNSCHLKCLHMLSVANTKPASLSPEDPVSSFLTSYHLKTIVLYMLLRWPDQQDWTQRQLSRQLQIALGMLEKHLECKWLPHCVQGSRDLGSLQGMSPVFPHTSSVNLFEPLKQDPHLHMVARKDFRRLTARLRMFTRSFCEKTRRRNSEIAENRLNEWPL
ncbi:inositol 1,4,5-trisphosphate receptor-interacting protein-like [Amia ocellicauda]|uniref:inositol 1,4,5-trisphosphate receptor-interacting protein-like n=1 Tax=Amia ocellicauda TaxID=2972642 RepID=UPI003464A6B7